MTFVDVVLAVVVVVVAATTLILPRNIPWPCMAL
jgi:hypothetical protein